MTPDNKNSPEKAEPLDFLEWLVEKSHRDRAQRKITTAESGSTKKETQIEDITEEFLATFGKGGKSGFQFFNTHGPTEQEKQGKSNEKDKPPLQQKSSRVYDHDHSHSCRSSPVRCLVQTTRSSRQSAPASDRLYCW